MLISERIYKRVEDNIMGITFVNGLRRQVT